MAVKLSTSTIDQNVLAKNVSFEAFKDMVNTTNTTNRGYVRFDRNAKGEIGVAKVSKHWYSSWLIDRRTNIDAGHNKQMRRLFVDSMKFDFLSQNTKDIIKNIKYVGGGDTLKDSALSRIEIKNAVEAYERDYNTKRADILINMLKDFCTKLNLPDAFQIANNSIDKKTQIKEFIKTYANLQTPEELNKLLADVDKALFSKTVYVLDKPKLDPTGKVQEDANGTSIEEFQKFMDNLRGTLERGIRVQQLKECVNFIFDAALKNTSIIGLLGEDGSKFLQQKDNNGMTHRDKLRSYLKSVMKDRIPNFNDGILTVTNEATDNLNVLDLFIDNIAGRILKQKIENCLEYQGMDENDIKELGVGSKEELIEKEKDISTILDSLTEYIDGVKNALNSEETDLSKALGGGLDKIVGKAVDSTGKTQDKQNLSDLMNVRYANMGMNVRGMVISAVLNSKTDGTEAGKVINDITDDMMKSVPSFAKRVRVDDFTHKYICEHFGGVNLDQGLTETQKVMDKVKQRVTDIKVALVIQNGNVRVKDMVTWNSSSMMPLKRESYHIGNVRLLTIM